MKPFTPLFKAAVIASSVLLVGGLIAYRVGAFDWPREIRPPLVGGAKAHPVTQHPVAPVAPQPSSDAAQSAPTSMSGPDTTTAEAESPPSGSKPPIIMHGSKSGSAGLSVRTGKH
jgi:hypothetical protein